MDLSLQKLKEAVSLREQIHSLEARLSSLFGGATQTSEGAPRRRRGKRRPMSAATRAKLAAAARARWANVRKAEGATKPAKSRKRRSGLTAAGRKKLSDSMKARWAARRKAAGGKGR